MLTLPVLSGWFLPSLLLFEILAKIAKLTATKVDPFQSVEVGCQPRRVRVYLFSLKNAVLGLGLALILTLTLT